MQITIIGCGNMGSGIAERLSKTTQVSLYDHHFEKAEKIAQNGYGKAFKELKPALDRSEVVLLAIKPQDLKEVAPFLRNELKKDQIVVSILAGTTLKTLKQFFPDTLVVRMMPNLALIYGEGVMGLSSDENVRALTDLFKPLGEIYWLPESQINGLTALTGSGPAFFFSMVEAMIETGGALGFTPPDAQKMVYQMLKGSLTLLENSGKQPNELIGQIASPKGTTIEGLKRFEELGIREGIMNTFLAAYERAKSMEGS